MLSYTILHVASGVSLQAIGTYMYVTSTCTCLMVINNFISTKGLFYYGSEGEMKSIFCFISSARVHHRASGTVGYHVYCIGSSVTLTTKLFFS